MFEDGACGAEWPPLLDEPATRPRGPAADERLWAALTEGPGPVAAAQLSLVDPARLRADDKVRLVQAWEAQIAHCQAAQAAALAALDSPHPLDEPALVLEPEFTDVEVRAALRLSTGAAADRLALGRDLARSVMRPTFVALAEGRISLAHAAVISAGPARPTRGQPCGGAATPRGAV